MKQIFNTGKVKIGIAYEAPKRVIDMDRDALRLQSALLGCQARIDRDGIAIIVGCLTFAGIILFPFWSR